MKSLWDDREAARFEGPLGARVYTSRLLGRERSLVLHGGGNTSVKTIERDVFGEDERILWVKGSGWDLETIEAAGFAPVRLERLIRLATLSALPDPVMVSELRAHMTRPSAPTPSVEAILHAILPYEYVDHTHADAIVAITNTEGGLERVREIYGDEVVIVPYVMPGFDLARAVAERFPREASARTVGVVLMSHGLFTFGATARESYERTIALVTRAEAYAAKRPKRTLTPRAPSGEHAIARADLRLAVSRAAGAPMLLVSDERGRAFAQEAADLSARGPATPDHVIRTKRTPLVGRDVDAYAAAYRAYFERNAPHAREPKTMLDPAPRVILDPELGMMTAGSSAKEARAAADIYAQTVDVILTSESLGGWRPLGERDIFQVEYWDLEQAKLRGAGKKPPFAGEVALVTGAASGIGRACVDALLARGAAVVGLDVDPRVTDLARADYEGVACDITTDSDALERASRAFGGVDMLVLSAGVFPESKRVAELDDAAWDRVMRVNLDANLSLLRRAHPLLARAPGGGRVVVIGSKNVPAPGPGVAAYSASKAALTQLARVAALEWGKDGVRVNVLHPNAVFDTAIWTPEVLASRAAHYGMSVEDYKKNNVLRVEVRSRDVAELAAEMLGPLFAKTTGAQLPIDGGNERVI